MTEDMILRAANEKVAEYMAQGYMIPFGAGSPEYKFNVNLKKDRHHISVQVVKSTCYDSEYIYQTDVLVLLVVDFPNIDELPCKNIETLYEQSFYMIHDATATCPAQYTTSLEEAKAMLNKRSRRRSKVCSTVPFSKKQLRPSDAFVRTLRTYEGFSRATRERIRVTRCANGYEVELLNRTGGAVRRLFFNLPKQRA